MVHLSKKYIGEEKLKKVFKLLYEILEDSKDEKEFLETIEEIISPTEQIMIAKRIAIVYLLLKGVRPKDISDYLKVSKSTIAKFNLLFAEKKESRIIKKIKSMLKKEKIANFFDDLFAKIFIRPGFLLGHWKLYAQHKRSQEERKYIDK